MLNPASIIKTSILGFALASSFPALHALDLIVDDFSSGSFSSGTKFTNTDIGGWHKRDSNGPDWAITGGVSGALTNSGTVANDEKPAFSMEAVSGGDSSLTQINVSFDYSVAAGSTLFFHAALMKGTIGTLNAGVSNSDGTYAGDQYIAGFSGSGVNLKDGSTPVAGDTNSIVSIVGSAGPNIGTFSQSFNIASYAGIDDITDVSYILAVFASDNDLSGGAISIDNLSITAVVPEPGTYALLAGLTGLVFVMVRRRA